MKLAGCNALVKVIVHSVIAAWLAEKERGIHRESPGSNPACKPNIVTSESRQFMQQYHWRAISRAVNPVLNIVVSVDHFGKPMLLHERPAI